MLASSPPSAPRISTITFLPSFGSFGTSSSLSSASSSLAPPLLLLDLGPEVLLHLRLGLAAEHLAGLGESARRGVLAVHLDDGA